MINVAGFSSLFVNVAISIQTYVHIKSLCGVKQHGVYCVIRSLLAAVCLTQTAAPQAT